MNPQFDSFTAFAEADDDSSFDYRIDDDSYGEDDETFGETDDDRAESDDDSAEFIGGLLSGGIGGIAKGIGGALSAVNRIVRPTRIGSRLNIPVPSLPSGITNGISAVSNLVGRITTPTGKQLPFKLPNTTATKADVAVLKKAIDSNSAAIKVNTSAIKKEAEAIVNLRKDVKEIDSKHIVATKEQNKIIEVINGRVSKLRKELDKTKQDAQMQTMMSMLMQPKLTSLSFENAPAQGDNKVSNSSFDSNNMFMLLALSGGFGGGGSDSNSLLPLMFLMKK